MASKVVDILSTFASLFSAIVMHQQVKTIRLNHLHIYALPRPQNFFYYNVMVEGVRPMTIANYYVSLQTVDPEIMAPE